ncbi:MAG: GNAT family protein [Actinomycetota bacterium]
MVSFATKPTITGERVLLRPVTGDDVDDAWADMHDDEANRLTGTHDEFTYEQIASWYSTRSDEPDRLDLAIVELATGRWCGEVVINEWDADNRSCSFRIAVSAHARDRGIGTAATKLLVDYVFDEIDEPAPINRIGLEVFAFNPRAIHVYERLGFVREGVLRDALYWDGAFHDAIVMSALRRDRPATR